MIGVMHVYNNSKTKITNYFPEEAYGINVKDKEKLRFCPYTWKHKIFDWFHAPKVFVVVWHHDRP